MKYFSDQKNQDMHSETNTLVPKDRFVEILSKTTEQLEMIVKKLFLLSLFTKQLHWNIKGENFSSIHTLLETFYIAINDHMDVCAERVVQLNKKILFKNIIDLTALSQLKDVNNLPELVPIYEESIFLIKKAISCFTEQSESNNEYDYSSEDILKIVLKDLEKFLWMIRASQ